MRKLRKFLKVRNGKQETRNRKLTTEKIKSSEVVLGLFLSASSSR
jgi:hypothetical protein